MSVGRRGQPVGAVPRPVVGGPVVCFSGTVRVAALTPMVRNTPSTKPVIPRAAGFLVLLGVEGERAAASPAPS